MQSVFLHLFYFKFYLNLIINKSWYFSCWLKKIKGTNSCKYILCLSQQINYPEQQYQNGKKWYCDCIRLLLFWHTILDGNRCQFSYLYQHLIDQFQSFIDILYSKIVMSVYFNNFLKLLFFFLLFTYFLNCPITVRSIHLRITDERSSSLIRKKQLFIQCFIPPSRLHSGFFSLFFLFSLFL